MELITTCPCGQANSNRLVDVPREFTPPLLDRTIDRVVAAQRGGYIFWDATDLPFDRPCPRCPRTICAIDAWDISARGEHDEAWAALRDGGRWDGRPIPAPTPAGDYAIDHDVFEMDGTLHFELFVRQDRRARFSLHAPARDEAAETRLAQLLSGPAGHEVAHLLESVADTVADIHEALTTVDAALS